MNKEIKEEPKKCMYSTDDYTDEDRKVLCDGCEEKCKYSKSDDFTKALAECIHQAQGSVVDPMAHAEIWKKELLELAKGKMPVSEELEQAIDTYLATYFGGEKEKQDWPFLKKMAIHFANWQKQQFEKNRLKHSNSITNEQAELEQGFIDQHFDKYQRIPTYLDAIDMAIKALKGYGPNLTENIAKTSKKALKQREKEGGPKVSEDLEEAAHQCYEPNDKFMDGFKKGAKWQKNHLWKPANGDDLPEIDREVIALLDNGKVVFAHRPPEFWDGKNIVTGKVTRNYPKTYDKGGWNIPDVKYWLDCSMPKEIEL